MNAASVNCQDVMCLVVIEISFNFGLFSSEVNNDTARALEQAHIVIQLRSHVSIQFINRLALNDSVSLAQEIYSIHRFHFFAMVSGANSQFLLILDTLFFQLHT